MFFKKGEKILKKSKFSFDLVEENILQPTVEVKKNELNSTVKVEIVKFKFY